MRPLTILYYFTIVFLSSTKAWALAPIESLVLGNFSDTYSESESDPLNYVFSRENSETSNLSYKHELALYRGFYEEGKNTINYCKNNREIHYRSEWEKAQVKRSLFSEIQYIGLDIVSRALPQYAKKLEFSRDEYVNLVEGLIGNFCSANLSVVSKKELKNNFLVKFDKENTFKLPNVTGNPYFPDNLDTYLPPKTALEQEFKYTVKLFQSVCSWGGDPTNPGLMVPILKNPSIMSFFSRQMNNQVIDWKATGNTLFLKEDKNTVQVWCDNLICRKISSDNFFHKVFFSVGGTNLNEDYKRLFCQEIKNISYSPTESDQNIQKIISARTAEEENFINSQFIALLTGVPDFLLRSERYLQGVELFRSSIDFTWSKWARSQTEMLNRDLFFEEPLTLEIISRKIYFNPLKSDLKVAFDVNLGEFDRINQRTGKVRVGFNIQVQRSFIHYYRETLKNLDPRNFAEKDRLLKRLKIQLTKDLALAKDKFIIAPWKGDLEALIAGEISEQLLLMTDGNFNMPKTGFEPIKIELNYGLFALKYINHQKIIQDSRKSNSISMMKN